MKKQIAGLVGALFALGAAAQPAAKPDAGAFECLLEPSMVANVGSPVDGVLDAVAVDRGDMVRKGQVVAKLQNGVETAAVKLSEARVEFAKRKVERNEALFEKQLVSAHERDEMVTEARLHEEELKRNQELLKQRFIVSPLDGVVVERRLSPGEFIRTDKSVVLRLARINPLNVEVVGPASLFGTVRVGMTGTVTIPQFPGAHRARVVAVDRVIDAASGTLGVRLELPNPSNRIPAGLKCSVVFGK